MEMRGTIAFLGILNLLGGIMPMIILGISVYLAEGSIPRCSASRFVDCRKKKNLRPIGRGAGGKPEGPEHSAALESGEWIGINSRL